MNWANKIGMSKEMERSPFSVKFQATTSFDPDSLDNYRGTLSSLWLKKSIKKALNCFRACGDKWTRTIDSRIFSPMLYQLSYITLL